MSVDNEPAEVDLADVGAMGIDLGALSSWVAALISAAILGMNLFIRRRDRPEPDWLLVPSLLISNPKITAHLSVVAPGKGEPGLVATLTNVGDGAAYRVGVTGQRCHVVTFVIEPNDARGFSTPENVARMESGDEAMLLIWPDSADATVTIDWRFSPTRHQRHGSVTIRLEDQHPMGKQRIKWKTKA